MLHVSVITAIMQQNVYLIMLSKVNYW